MITTQTSIAIQIISTLSQDELATFAIEFEKMFQPKIKPQKKAKDNLPDIKVLANQVLNKHRARFNNIPKQGKLA